MILIETVRVRSSTHVVLAAILLTFIAKFAEAGNAKRVVAVFDIDASGTDISESAQRTLSEYMSALVASAPGFEVVPRADIKSRLSQEKRASYDECYDQACQIEIGKELAASHTISARLMRIGQRCIVTLSLLNLRTATAETASTLKGGCGQDELVDLVDQATNALVRDNSAKKPEPDPEPSSAPEWVPAASPGIEFHRTEVTIEQYARCVDEGACSFHSPKDERCNWSKKSGQLPMNCVSWWQAGKFCTWAGGRLPTEAEWVREATASGSRPYPWGAEKEDCTRAVIDVNGDGCRTGGTIEVCSRPKGNSATGACDLIGNVWEWIAAEDDAKKRIVRGGSYINEPGWATNGKARYEYDASARFDPTVGFRCVRDRKK